MRIEKLCANEYWMPIDILYCNKIEKEQIY